MIRNYLLTGWRNISRNRLYTLLNVLGLSLGITTCLFLYRYITFHNGYDRFHPKANRTFRLVHELHLQKTEYSPGASYAMYRALRDEIPEAEQVTFLMRGRQFTLGIDGARYKTGKLAVLTSADWFDLFAFPWLEGNPLDLDHAGTMALGRETARTYFGETDPMGKTVLVDGKHPFKVVGIVDDSRYDTSLRAGIYLSISSLRTLAPETGDAFFRSWDFLDSSNNVFVALRDPAQKKQVEEKLMQLAARNLDPSVVKAYRFKLLPLREAHFDMQYGGTVRKSLLVVLGIIGCCIMAVAAINYVNLSVSQQARRSTEIGTRKVLGGSARQLFALLLTESALVTFVASVVSVILLQVLLPLANRYLFAGEPLPLFRPLTQVLLAIGFWLVATVISGVYPAYVLTRLHVFDALKNRIPLQGGAGRQSLVLFQNVVAQVMLIGALIVMWQIRYLSQTDMGFTRDAVVMIPLPKNAGDKAARFSATLSDHPGIRSRSLCFQAPSGSESWGGTVRFGDRAEWEAWPARYVYADSGYVSSFNIRLKAGRNIRQDAPVPEYLVNETFVARLGFRNPSDVLGKYLLAGGMNDEKPGIVAGVLSDFNTHALTSPIEPMVMGYLPHMTRHLALKLSGASPEQTLGAVRKSWEAIFPGEVFDFHFLDEQIRALYAKELLLQKLVRLSAAITLVISALGLLGMVSMMTLRRTREVGIRKVLGASVAGITQLLCREFLVTVGAAFLIATPLAAWLAHRWLQEFAFRIEIRWWMFAAAGGISLLVALFTAGIQAIAAARANPVKSLRNE